MYLPTFRAEECIKHSWLPKNCAYCAWIEWRLRR
jgi:hypothetical protein